MCHIITSYRTILYYKQMPDLKYLGITAAVSVAVMFIGFAVFGRLKKRFAETL